MKFNKLNVVTLLLSILVILTMIGRIFSIKELSNYSWITIFPLFAYLYYGQAKKKNHFFGFFLIGFSISEIFKIVFVGYDFLAYYMANLFVVTGYLSLIIFLVKDINLKLLIKDFKLPLIVLTVFNTYIIYVLNQMIMQDESLVMHTLDFTIEVTYNVLILLVLSLSLIHYLYHQSRQGILLFLASVCIVFSEMVQVAYLFISSEQLLQIMYSILMGIGFYFLYIFIKINYLAIKKQTQVV